MTSLRTKNYIPEPFFHIFHDPPHINNDPRYLLLRIEPTSPPKNHHIFIIEPLPLLQRTSTSQPCNEPQHLIFRTITFPSNDLPHLHIFQNMRHWYQINKEITTPTPHPTPELTGPPPPHLGMGGEGKWAVRETNHFQPERPLVHT